MHIQILLRICGDSGRRFMGPGPYALLRGVEKYGSIRKSAINLNMSYAKAHRILTSLEKELGIKLMNRYIGGYEHGGAELTKEASLLLDHYDSMLKKLQEAAKEPWQEFLQAADRIKHEQELSSAASQEHEELDS
ncbi:MAG: winged helix-turn-helix domain-containing protein [Candidatus Bruticola sp.]